MLDSVSDDAFARYVKQTGMATPDQIDAARKSAGVPLAEALVKMGVITPLQRETVEKKLEGQREGVGELGGCKLIRKIGEGGMGAVYLAEETARKRKVALKVLPKKHASDEQYLQRFRREIEAATKLDHPNIVQAYSAGEERGYHFFLMEYVEGESLRKRIERLKFLPAPDACAVVRQIALGLKHAHEQGFVHRDVKPDNVIVTPAGVVKLLDLGLAKNLEDTQASFRTVTGAALGTPHYISPEQARGEKDVDGRSDIYSLGATFYHLVTGQVPFQGSSIFEIIQKHLMEQLADPRDLRPDIPEAVVDVVRRMLAKAPADRYPNCAALVQDLERLAAKQAPLAPPIDASRSSVAMPKSVAAVPPRNGAKMRVGAAAAALISGIAIYAVWPSAPEPQLPKKAEPVTVLKKDPPKPERAKVDPPKREAPKPEPEPPKPEPVKPDPEPAKPVTAKAPDYAIREDLIKRIPVEHYPSFRGNWQLQNGALLSSLEGENLRPTLILLPVAFSEEYDLVIEAQRVGGSEDIVFGLASRTNEFAMGIDGWGGQASGLNGRSANNGNFAWQRMGRGRIFADGKVHTIKFEVRRAGAVMKVDEESIVTLSDYRNCSIPASMTEGRRPPGALSISTVRSSYRITKVSYNVLRP